MIRFNIRHLATVMPYDTVYAKKYAHGFCFAVLCCGYTSTDFPISIRLTSLALWQSNDCPSASKATLMNMDKYFMWIHYERLHNHNKAKHNKTVCIFLGIYCTLHYMRAQEALMSFHSYEIARSDLGTRFNIKTVFSGIRITIMKINSITKIMWSQDHLLFIMGINILIRRHLYNEPAPSIPRSRYSLYAIWLSRYDRGQFFLSYFFVTLL